MKTFAVFAIVAPAAPLVCLAAAEVATVGAMCADTSTGTCSPVQGSAYLQVISARAKMPSTMACPAAYESFPDQICKIASGAQPQYWYKGGGTGKPDSEVVQTHEECKALCDGWTECQAYSYYPDHYNGYRAQCNIVPASAAVKDNFAHAGEATWKWYSHGTDGAVVGAYDFNGFTCYLKSCRGPTSYTEHEDQLCKIASGAQPQYWYKGGGTGKPDSEVVQTHEECKALCDGWTECQAYSYYPDYYNAGPYRAQCNIVPTSAAVKDDFAHAGEAAWKWYSHGTDGAVVGGYAFSGFTCYVKEE